MNELSKDQIKVRAKYLRELLREKHKIDLPHGHALEVLAKVLGFNDWNTAAALSPKSEIGTPADAKVAIAQTYQRPIATKLLTTGEATDFFSSFDRGTKLSVNEYSSGDSLGDSITSVCSLTYDSEIQRENEVVLELNTELERSDNVTAWGRSASQTFEKTTAGRSQRRIKYLSMLKGFWNPVRQ